MKKKSGKQQSKGDNVSLDGISLKDALSGLLAIPDPETTKPVKEKEKRAEQKGRKHIGKKAPPPKKG